MRQRIAVLGGVGVAVVLGLLLFWGGIAPKPVSAMEQMAAAIRQGEIVQMHPGITKVTLHSGRNPPKRGETTYKA